MLEIKSCCLVVIDVQGKLAQLMHSKESLFNNIQILIKAAKILEIPIIWCQQVPAALGPTLPEIEQLLEGQSPVNKSSFSCCGDEKFSEKLKSLESKQFVLCGIETHVCVYQTAMDLLEREKEVYVTADAVSSRALENKEIALDRMKQEGIKMSSVEMVLFELLKTAKHSKFGEVCRLIR